MEIPRDALTFPAARHPAPQGGLCGPAQSGGMDGRRGRLEKLGLRRQRPDRQRPGHRLEELRSARAVHPAFHAQVAGQANPEFPDLFRRSAEGRKARPATAITSSSAVPAWKSNARPPRANATTHRPAQPHAEPISRPRAARWKSASTATRLALAALPQRRARGRVHGSDRRRCRLASGITLVCNSPERGDPGNPRNRDRSSSMIRANRHRSEERGDPKTDSLISREDDRWGGRLMDIRKCGRGLGVSVSRAISAMTAGDSGGGCFHRVFRRQGCADKADAKPTRSCSVCAARARCGSPPAGSPGMRCPPSILC